MLCIYEKRLLGKKSQNQNETSTNIMKNKDRNELLSLKPAIKLTKDLLGTSGWQTYWHPTPFYLVLLYNNLLWFYILFYCCIMVYCPFSYTYKTVFLTIFSNFDHGRRGCNYIDTLGGYNTPIYAPKNKNYWHSKEKQQNFDIFENKICE